MQATQFDRDAMAGWYAQEHLKVDPGVQAVYYLIADAPEREIRFLEINTMMAERDDEILEPLDFGVDVGSEVEHKLFVLDITPSQWELIQRSALHLPRGWSLAGARIFSRSAP